MSDRSSTLLYNTKLYRKIDKYFSLSELRELVLDLRIDIDNLTGETKRLKASALVIYLERRGRIEELYSSLEQRRPNVDWRIGQGSETVASQRTTLTNEMENVSSLAGHLNEVCEELQMNDDNQIPANKEELFLRRCFEHWETMHGEIGALREYLTTSLVRDLATLKEGRELLDRISAFALHLGEGLQTVTVQGIYLRSPGHVRMDLQKIREFAAGASEAFSSLIRQVLSGKSTAEIARRLRNELNELQFMISDLVDWILGITMILAEADADTSS